MKKPRFKAIGKPSTYGDNVYYVWKCLSSGYISGLWFVPGWFYRLQHLDKEVIQEFAPGLDENWVIIT